MDKSERRLGEREMVPVEVFIIYPRISFETSQSPSPAVAFFRLMDYHGVCYLEGLQHYLHEPALLRLVPLCQAIDVVHIDVIILETGETSRFCWEDLIETHGRKVKQLRSWL